MTMKHHGQIKLNRSLLTPLSENEVFAECEKLLSLKLDTRYSFYEISLGMLRHPSHDDVIESERNYVAKETC